MGDIEKFIRKALIMFVKIIGNDQYEVKREHDVIVVTYKRGCSSKVQKYPSNKNWGICAWFNGYHIKDISTNEVLFGFVGDDALTDANTLLSIITE